MSIKDDFERLRELRYQDTLSLAEEFACKNICDALETTLAALTASLDASICLKKVLQEIADNGDCGNDRAREKARKALGESNTKQ